MSRRDPSRPDSRRGLRCSPSRTSFSVRYVAPRPDEPRPELAAERRRLGLTLIELLVTVAILGILTVALGGVVGNALEVRADTGARAALGRDAHFAMQRMVGAVGRTEHLLIPQVDKAWSGWDESTRDPGVLAVTLDPELDRDLDGYADADNDRDGRVDEDTGADWTADGGPGLVGVDDDGDGTVDESASSARDDDESGDDDEDPIDGLDQDVDQNVDEDPPADANGDSAPGIEGVDDDGDGAVDEGTSAADDDEDGADDEDWLDAVAYFLSGTDLIERFPDPSAVDGADFTERVIAENVRAFRVTRLPRVDERAQLVDIELELGTAAASVAVRTSVRVGGRR